MSWRWAGRTYLDKRRQSGWRRESYFYIDIGFFAIRDDDLSYMAPSTDIAEGGNNVFERIYLHRGNRLDISFVDQSHELIEKPAQVSDLLKYTA